MGKTKYQGRKKGHERLSVMFFPSVFVYIVPLPDVEYPSIYKLNFGRKFNQVLVTFTHIIMKFTFTVRYYRFGET